MKKLLLFILALILIISQEAMSSAQDNFVVQIFSTYQSYNAFYPWVKDKFNTRTAFGTLLDNGYILTTADTITDFAFIELKKPQSEKKYSASVAYVDYECNIALLTSRDKEFYKDLMPIKLSGSLNKNATVNVIQIKSNNDINSVQGKVEKVSVEESYLGWDEHLSYLISVKLENRSHWAEPVLKDNNLAGIVTTYDSNRFLATVIPVELIKHFIKDISDKEYNGFPDPGFYWEPISNPLLKEHLGMKKNTTGIYITRVIPKSSAGNILQEGDVLLKVEDTVIDDKGYYIDKTHGKLLFTYLFTSRFPGEKINIEILRNKKQLKRPMLWFGWE